jgi:hypothetical protein
MSTVTRAASVLVAIMLLGGCGTTAGTHEARSDSVSKTTQSATSAPTTFSQQPSAEASAVPGHGSIETQIVRAQPWIGHVFYQVFITVKNDGAGWIDSMRGHSDYTVYGPNNGVTTVGTFRYAYPRFLGPGETGYLLDEGSSTGTTLGDFVRVEASFGYKAVAEPGPILVADKVSLKPNVYGSLDVTGTVTNEGTVGVSDTVVGVVMFDAAGKPLAFDYNNSVSNPDSVKDLAAGQTKGFAIAGYVPVLLADVASTKAFASSVDM